jgi:hypothetical protein
MASLWCNRPLRTAALQCDYENGKNLEVIDHWAKMGFNVEYLKHLLDNGGVMAEFDLKTQGKKLRRYLDRAKVKNLRIILYMNVHILPPDLTAHTEEWCQRQADGTFHMNYSTYYALCVRSPWRERFFKQLDALRDFALDGVFLDGPCVMTGGCFCATCRRQFREEYGHELTAATPDALWRFNADTMIAFVRDARKRFQAIHPDGAFHNNLDAMHPTASFLDLKAALALNDIVGTEGGFFQLTKSSFNWKPNLTARLLEGLAPDKPRLNCMASNHYPLSWYPHTATETALCIASTAAGACSLWYGLHGSTELLKTPGCQAAGKWVRELAKHEAYYHDAPSLATTAVLYSFDTEKMYKATIDATDLYGKTGRGKDFAGDFTRAQYGTCDLLIRSAIPFDVVNDLDLTADKLNRYGCLILPTCACLSEENLETIRRYVAAGGHVIAGFDTSLYRPDGSARDNFALADVFGADFAGGYTAYRDWNYFQTIPSHAFFAGVKVPLIPAPATGINVKPADSAETLARFLEPLPGRYDKLRGPGFPAFIFNRYGRGACLFLAGTFAEDFHQFNREEHKTIVANAVKTFAPAPARLEGADGLVELVVRRQGAKILVHLINYSGPFPRPLERTIPMRDFRLCVRTADHVAVRALFSGERLDARRESEELVVQIPLLNEYEVIVVE